MKETLRNTMIMIQVEKHAVCSTKGISTKAIRFTSSNLILN